MTGEQLSSEEYLEDFYPRFWAIGEQDFWKFERLQSFQEQGSDSWEAFKRGDWLEALHLIEERRDSLKEYYERVSSSGFTTYRVRVVEEEITPYLQWQIHSLKQRAELGEHIRIIGQADIGAFERDGRLPEIVTVGTNATYQVLYDHTGVLTGAVRSDRPEDLAMWRNFIEELYQKGEDVSSFFERRVASMKPPRTT
ncbi:hypothetical protein DQ384_09015 [Sphaerisporangium album]|uniref:DUF6879 domain-containing protein n=1 Tax=Sphaerisporangium album TaxID=509200 RepID=A0A367FNQ4_9ACTN|nr:hypothetical protein DQ384_09015 [Sphaerisporangium album]